MQVLEWYGIKIPDKSMCFCKLIKSLFCCRKMKKVLDRKAFPLGEEYVDKINSRFIEGDEITLCVIDNDFSGENIFCALVDDEHLEECLKYHTWEISPGDYSNRIDEHHNKFLNFRKQPEPGVTPLVYLIYPEDERKSQFIINNDFRTVYSLFEKCIDHQTTYYVQTTRTCKEIKVLWVEDNVVKANVNYIKEFLGITGQNLLLYYSTMLWTDKTYEELGIKRQINIPADCEDVAFLFSHLTETGLDDTKKAGAWFQGKCVIRHEKVKELGAWDVNAEGYETFIVGQDDGGNEITMTCDDNQLPNLFTRKGDEYWTLTPVYFCNEVLEKYLANADRYHVNDAYLDAPAWGLKMDNDRTDGLVVVFLKDLGDLPFEEQLHWRKFNIIPPATSGLSDTSFMRSFLGVPTNPSVAPALIFKQKYTDLGKVWNAKYGWDLIKPLSVADEKDFNNLHQMTDENNLKDFTYQILTLTRSIIDSLNEKELLNNIDVSNPDYQKYMSDHDNKMDGSLLRLEWYMRTRGCYNAGLLNYLRKLQSYRSKNAAHRRGTADKEMKKLERFFDLDKKTQKDVLDGIFCKLTGYLEYFESLCK